jgi:hypothetical protein
VKLRGTLQLEGFEASENDPCLFMRDFGERKVFVLVHVDDCLLVGDEKFTIDAIEHIKRHFEIKDLGEAKFFLGQEIQRRKEGIFVAQEQYTKDLLVRFGFWEGKPKKTPIELGLNLQRDEGKEWPEGDPRKTLYMEMVGSLLYLIVHTRPDIAHAVGVLSRYMSYPPEEHMHAAKRVLRYLRGTLSHGILFPSGKQGVRGDSRWDQCEVYADADWGGDKL